MDKSTAQRVVSQTFKAAFDRDRFRNFVNELTNGFDETKKQTMQIPDAFKPHVASCQRIGTYESPESELADVLIVHLTESYKLERTRTALRDFVAHKLKRGDGEDNAYKEAALVAFVAPDAKSWRFSFVRIEYETKRDPKTGRIKPEERLTPARRYSYLVGAEEECHTAQARFLDLLKDTTTSPTLAKIEEAFSVESVTKEFFDKYAALFQRTHAALEAIIAKDKVVRADFKSKDVCTVDFAKKLLGQIDCPNYNENLHSGDRCFLRKTGDSILACPPSSFTKAVAHQNVYVVKSKSSNWDIWSLLGFLNSSVATFLYQAGIYGQKGRTLAQFRIYGLEVIPIPTFEDSEIKEISSITRRIFTEAASAQEINKLNAIVFKGYGLDPAGSKAIEEFLS